MSDALEIPDFGELLRPTLGRVDVSLLPVLLAGLERGAAHRYRAWAEACPDPDAAQSLRACAAREDEIAERVERLFPVGASERERVESLLPAARDTFLAVFEPHPLRDQYRIQASAERQGAVAWRGLADSHADAALQSELRACAELEEQSAAALEKLLAG